MISADLIFAQTLKFYIHFGQIRPKLSDELVAKWNFGKNAIAHILTKYSWTQLNTQGSGEFAIFARHDVKIEV